MIAEDSKSLINDSEYIGCCIQSIIEDLEYISTYIKAGGDAVLDGYEESVDDAIAVLQSVWSGGAK